MAKLIALGVVLVAFAGAAVAQPAAGSAGSAGSGASAGSAGSGASVAGAAEAQPPVSPPASAAIDPRRACTEAMNADPKFAAAITKVADEQAAVQRDKDTLDAHQSAYAHVQKNEKHVIYSYAAMWIVAALFVLFLWRRQQALNAEIASLRRDLAAAADDAPKGRA
ncbi:MAG TPA: hypothetical protein VH165_21760 [Kofleriaceae bacterium]|jgi:hypothetical protein|nr:hypothetical protein [Kofleriaceae bacterium]